MTRALVIMQKQGKRILRDRHLRVITRLFEFPAAADERISDFPGSSSSQRIEWRRHFFKIGIEWIQEDQSILARQCEQQPGKGVAILLTWAVALNQKLFNFATELSLR